MKIKKIDAYEILDSRGTPTVATRVTLENDIEEFGFVPSGASTGSKEAVEKRDKAGSFNGKGVQGVKTDAEKSFFPAFIGMEVENQLEIDRKIIELDGTENKAKVGANITLALSLATCKAAAAAKKKKLYSYINTLFNDCFNTNVQMKMPLPMMNILNGGAHANNGLDFQEFMIQPVGFSSFKKGLTCGVEVFNSLKETLDKKGFSTAVGDEGGFAPEINSPQEALTLISEAILSSGYKVEEEVTFALDCASTEIFDDGSYIFSDKKKFSSDELINYLKELRKSYPITSIEDALDENDWQGWNNLTKEMGKETQLVGDDLFVTNKNIFQEGIQKNLANSILIKINQIGTLTETLETINLAKENNYKTVISHRSGETEDSFIADLAVGSGAGQIKTGAPSRSDRTSKYNRLLMIDSWENFEFLGRNELNK